MKIMKSFKRLAVMAVVCFVTVAMNAQVVRDTVVVNQKEAVVFEGNDTTFVVSQKNGKEWRAVGRHAIKTQNTKNMSVKELQQNLSDEVKIYDKKHHSLLGRNLHGLHVFLGGGCNLIDGDFNPSAVTAIEWQTCDWILGVEGSFTRQRYPDEAIKDGFYKSFIFTVNGGYKVWQNRRRTSNLAAILHAGYGLHQTDDKTVSSSANHGFAGGASVRLTTPIARRLYLSVEAGWIFTPSVEHSVGKQDISNHGPRASVKVSYEIPTR